MKYGQEHEHDKLSKLEQPALDWNNFLADETGVRVEKITKWILHEDVKRLETAEIEQDTIKEKLLVQREAETNLLKERSARERAALQHMYILHQQLSSTAAYELKTILQERIRDAFESGEHRQGYRDNDLLNALYKGIEKFSYSKISKINNGAFTGENGTITI